MCSRKLCACLFAKLRGVGAPIPHHPPWSLPRLFFCSASRCCISANSAMRRTSRSARTWPFAVTRPSAHVRASGSGHVLLAEQRVLEGFKGSAHPCVSSAYGFCKMVARADISFFVCLPVTSLCSWVSRDLSLESTSNVV